MHKQHPMRGFPTTTLRPARVLVAATLSLLLAACASTAPASGDLHSARDTLLHAVSMDGDTFAPREMGSARERIERAQVALSAGNQPLARALSEEALADLQLAQARVRSERAQKAAAELREGRRALNQEIQNNTQPQAAP